MAWDVSRNTFRREIAATYKSNRKPTDAPLKTQFIHMQNLLRAIGIQQLLSDPTAPISEIFEADDYLGSMAAKFETEIVIVGDDSLMNIDQYSIQRVAPEQNKTEDLLTAYAPSTDAKKKNTQHLDAKRTTVNAQRRKRKKQPKKKSFWQKLVS